MSDLNIPISVYTNGLELIASGVVHLTTPDVLFHIGDLKVKFIFKVDAEGARYDGLVDNGVLVISLYNFSNALGEGNPDPISIAKIKGRELFVTYYVKTLPNGMREFTYTFLLGCVHE